MLNFDAARVNMVEGQIRPNRVTDTALIAALRDIPREMFVPDSARGIAYVDEEIEVAAGRRLLEPMILARLLQEADITPRDVVLEIGCGTGYSTAILSRLASTVVALESDPELFARASKTLAAMAMDSVISVNGPLVAGCPAQAPYDVIIINGAVSEVPAAILEQLADGGRLVAVVAYNHDIARLGQAWLYKRIGNSISGVSLFEASAPLLPGFEFKPRFVF
ncbi:MAG: protein-L-isoaspartate O-methyltransferase [Rhodospirillaceae bacterium]